MSEQRAIKFRAWDKHIGEFHFWDFDHADRKDICWQIFESDCYRPQQFTGVKDKNGKEIYEGDIYEVDMEVVKMYVPHYSQERFVEEVYFSNGEFQISYKDWLDKIEVIGNIHENPDLLK